MVNFLCTLLIAISFIFGSISVRGQHSSTFSDVLRGNLSVERSNYDVHHYDLKLEIFPESGVISGKCRISYHWLGNDQGEMQIDLFSHYIIDSVVSSEGKVLFRRQENAFFISRPLSDWVEVYYHGKPQVAKNPPWEGGFVWSEDKQGKYWAGVACEGLGASAWWPMKDHLSDEPDSMDIHYIIPSHIRVASNGRLVDSFQLDNASSLWHFQVQCPINSYNVTFYLGDYLPFNATYKGKAGILDLKYYFLKDQYAEKVRFFKREVPRMLNAFEHYFGPYPCYSDGYGLAEAPYWGMEHQGMIAYGNQMKLLPKYKFDFILVHESGHEWFGNSISCDDHAEMWIHEGFTTYSEALYVEHYQGYLKSLTYLGAQRKKIVGAYPILGPRNVNYRQKDADIYYKGSWFIHTLRHIFHNDISWFNAILSFSQNNRYRIMRSDDVVDHFQKYTHVPLAPIFDQYLKAIEIPELELYQDGDGKWKSRWLNVMDSGFYLPVYGRKGKRLDPHGISGGERKVRKSELDYVERRYLIQIRLSNQKKDSFLPK